MMVEWSGPLSLRSPVFWVVALIAGILGAVVVIGAWPDKAQLEAVSQLSALGAALEFDDDRNVKAMRIPPGTSLKALEYVGALPHLKSLILPVTEATDEDLVPLRAAAALEELILSGNPGITDTGLKNLEGLANLNTVYLTDVPIDGTGLESLGRLPKLEVLNLSYTKLNEAHLAHLSRTTTLRVLDLSYTDVSDAGLDHLRELSNLEMLVVMATKVTPEGGAEFNKLLPKVNLRFGL